MITTHRLFFALWPSDILRAALASQAMLAVKPFKGKPVPAANLHVTLAFLGSVADARLAELHAIGRDLPVTACVLELDRLVVWPRARVLAWLASELPAALVRLVETLRQRLVDAHFEMEVRPYRAHVTLARDVRASALEEAITPLHWPVNDVALVTSTSSPQGSRYEVMARF